MTKDQKYQKLRNVIIKAVPSIKKQMDTIGEVFTEREITLCDCLLACKKINPDFYAGLLNISGIELNISGLAQIAISWNKENNSLDSQSEECKQFLYDLLVDKK